MEQWNHQVASIPGQAAVPTVLLAGGSQLTPLATLLQHQGYAVRHIDPPADVPSADVPSADVPSADVPSADVPTAGEADLAAAIADCKPAVVILSATGLHHYRAHLPPLRTIHPDMELVAFGTSPPSPSDRRLVSAYIDATASPATWLGQLTPHLPRFSPSTSWKTAHHLTNTIHWKHIDSRWLQGVLQALPDRLYYLSANGQMQPLYPKAAALPQGTPPTPHLPPRALLVDILHRWHSDSQVHTLTYSAPQGDLSLWFEARIAPLSPERKIMLVRDITQQRLAQDRLQQQAIRDPLIAASLERIHSSLDVDTILNTAVQEVQQQLSLDRVVIYQFDGSGHGHISHESCRDPRWSILSAQVTDHCFDTLFAPLYVQGRAKAVADVATHPTITPCHQAMLERFQVRAKLVVPIVQRPSQDEPYLWGLLIAHQCQGPRTWSDWEIEVLQQLSRHLGIAIQQRRLYEQLQAANAELRRIALLDGLTQIANRRHFDTTLQDEWQRLGRERGPLSLLLCDVDFFKLYNDTYGHLQGDDCLRQVAQSIARTIKRPADLVARYGGEEFAVLLPNTDLAGAQQVAHAIEQAVAALTLAHQGSPISPHITLSVGLATLAPALPHTPTTLIERADQALYQAKRQGRHCTVAWSKTLTLDLQN